MSICFFLLFLMLLTLCKGGQWSTSWHTIGLTTTTITSKVKNENSRSTFNSWSYNKTTARWTRRHVFITLCFDHLVSLEREREKKRLIMIILLRKELNVLFHRDRYISLLDWTALSIFICIFFISRDWKKRNQPASCSIFWHSN
jgi:hypothetical protein